MVSKPCCRGMQVRTEAAALSAHPAERSCSPARSSKAPPPCASPRQQSRAAPAALRAQRISSGTGGLWPRRASGWGSVSGGRDALPPRHAYCTCFTISALLLFFCLFNEKGYFTQATDKTTPPDVLHVHSWSFKEVARSSRAALT